MAQAAKKKFKKKQGQGGSALEEALAKKDEQISYEVAEEETIAGSRVRFKLKMGEDAIKHRLEETYKEFNKVVNVPGFRPGHAPRKLIKARFEKQVREETVKRMVGRLSEMYAKEKGYEVLSQPYLLDYKSTEQDGTAVELAFEVKPQVEVSDDLLKGLKAEIHEVRIDDDYVERSLQQLREQSAQYEPTEEGYKPKDGMLLNCKVSDTHGNAIPERSAQGHYSTRIEDEMPEEVAKALVGKKPGESLSMDVTEQVEGAAEGTLETVHYDVDVLEVKARVLPELDDEFAKDVADEYQTLEDLREGTKINASQREAAREREEALEDIFEQLRGRVEIDLPRVMVEETANRTVNQMEQRLNQMGISLRMMDQSIVRNYAQSVGAQARATVKNQLLLEAIAKHLGIEVTEDAINAELEKAAAASGRKPLAIRAQLEAKKQWDAFIEDLRLKLANDAILGRAEVTKKPVSAEEFEALARKRQEEQAARLRGEAVKAEEAEAAADEALDKKQAEGAAAEQSNAPQG